MDALQIQKLLIRQIQNGNNRIYDEFFDLHESIYKAVVNKSIGIFKLNNERDEIEQIARLAFYTAVTHFDTNQIRSFNPYLITVIKNKIIDYVRRKSKHSTLQLSDQYDDLVGEEIDRFEDYVSGLDDLLRDIVTRKIKHRETFLDIQRNTNIPRSTLIRKYKKGLNQIKNELTEYC